MNRFFAELRRRVGERAFLSAAAGVLATPPCVPRDDGLVIFSMIGTRVLTPYLVAAKSLHAQLQRGRFAILDDGTLTREDKAILRNHLGDPQIFGPDVDTKACPTYSSWKRLFTLLELRKTNYVIQLDSDTITRAPVRLLGELIDAGRDFILKGEAETRFMSLEEIAAQAQANPNSRRPPVHVQLAMEARMDEVRIPDRANLRYSRGCAGFAGFAPDPSGTELAEQFSAEAVRLIGYDHWKQWGSEQVTSNFLIAQRPDAALLPYDRYCNFWDEPVSPEMAFVHFIGTYRYHGGVYRDMAREAIESLRLREAIAA
ncbi:hypothetical protein VCJ71_12010 [Alteriqipengyuania sp. WL0013]|uniref:hypothetical protein n=1 Tax=Alteriqipengyuania sp. WL0013 TaxID=3110773 RepID=UPI002C9CDA35|nr:hypothetical protein [Alteriqipengyuania sp. WL0013]MEB3416793.1 hypothetical protein [Alteriqipengyuania sp. WL0013]